MVPKDENELRHMLFTALRHPGPTAIRYPRGRGLGVSLDPDYRVLPIGEAEVVREGNDLMIIALGTMVNPSMEAAEILDREGLSSCVVNCRFVKPLDPRLADHARSIGKVIVVEENIKQGGLSSAVLELFSDNDLTNICVKRMGLPDQFIEHGPVEVLRSKYGLDRDGILKTARDLVETRKRAVFSLAGKIS